DRGARAPHPEPGGGDAPGRQGAAVRVRGAPPGRGRRPPQGAEGPAPGGSGDLSPTLAVRAPLAWLGPGKVIDRVSVVCDGGRIQWVGSARLAPQADDELEVEGFLMPGVAGRHVHIGLADPGAVLLGGVTAVRDLAWPPDVIFPLAAASELPAFNGPLIRAAGPMLTAPGGYPTTDRWAPAGTGLEIKGAEQAAKAVVAMADRGAAAIKVSLNAEAGPTPTDRELAAIVQAGGERGPGGPAPPGDRGHDLGRDPRSPGGRAARAGRARRPHRTGPRSPRGPHGARRSEAGDSGRTGGHGDLRATGLNGAPRSTDRRRPRC